MKIHCVYTPAHEVLYRDWFLPSVPDGIDVVAEPLPIAGEGNYLSEEFLRCIRAKVERVVRSIEENSGGWIVWSDVDILLSADLKRELEAVVASAGDKRMFFQRETREPGEVNTGFILIYCDPATAGFFREVGNLLGVEREKNEQAVINRMLTEGRAVGWGYLPVEFVARTHGWPPRKRWVIYHANYTIGDRAIAQKIRQFRQVRAMQRWGLPAVAWAVMTRAWEKLRGA